jgi:hypothetical protein
MRSNRACCLLLVVLSQPFLLLGQNVNPMHPVEIEAQKQVSPDDMRNRVADIQLQKDTKELSELCASLPDDMASVKQGLLPKETIEKLKRLEKLSKRVREQLARASDAH